MPPVSFNPIRPNQGPAQRKVATRRLSGCLNPSSAMRRLVEIRSYKLQPGTSERFHALVREQAIPMLKAVQMDVVAFGPSLHEPDTYFLIRAYADLSARHAEQEAFYGSTAWREGPRETILFFIQSYLNTVVWMSPEAVEDLRKQNQ